MRGQDGIRHAAAKRHAAKNARRGQTKAGVRGMLAMVDRAGLKYGIGRRGILIIGRNIDRNILYIAPESSGVCKKPGIALKTSQNKTR